jgi:hypothetical protein
VSLLRCLILLARSIRLAPLARLSQIGSCCS